MERVKEGELYWYVNEMGDVTPNYDSGRYGIEDLLLEAGNYFPDTDEGIDAVQLLAKKFKAVLKGAEVIEKWQVKEIANTLRVALNTEYGITGLDDEEEIKKKINNETCLARMLKNSIKIIEDVKSKIVK